MGELVKSQIPIQDEPVLDPRDGSIVTDPVLALAIKEDCVYITKRRKLAIQWTPFMKNRRKYRDAPEYAKLTPRQIELYWKLREGNFMPLAAVRLILNKGTSWKTWEILKAKKIPIYKFPPTDEIRILSTDFLLMVDSCQIDVDAEGGVWKQYLDKKMLTQDTTSKRDTAQKRYQRRAGKRKSAERAMKRAGAAGKLGGDALDALITESTPPEMDGSVPASASAERIGTRTQEAKG